MFTCRLSDDAELRLKEVHHAEEIFAAVDANREHLRRWMHWVDKTRSAEDVRTYIRGALEQFARGETIAVGLWWRGRVAGSVGVHDINPDYRRCEVGYWLTEPAQGRGLMTAACRALIDHLFRERGLNRVEIRCEPDNRRSRAIPERLGFVQEGVLRQAAWLYGRPADHVVYGMLAADWRGKTGG